MFKVLMLPMDSCAHQIVLYPIIPRLATRPTTCRRDDGKPVQRVCRLRTNRANLPTAQIYNQPRTH